MFLTEPEAGCSHPDGFEALVEGPHGPEWTTIARDGAITFIVEVYEVRGSVRSSTLI